MGGKVKKHLVTVRVWGLFWPSWDKCLQNYGALVLVCYYRVSNKKDPFKLVYYKIYLCIFDLEQIFSPKFCVHEEENEWSIFTDSLTGAEISQFFLLLYHI